MYHEDIITGTIIISWTPPYTLQRVPILYYIESSQCTSHTRETSETSVAYQINAHNLQSQPFNIIKFTVTPVNRAGEGKAAVVTQVKNITKGMIGK